MKRSTSFYWSQLVLSVTRNTLERAVTATPETQSQPFRFDLSPAIALHDSLPNDVSSRYTFIPLAADSSLAITSAALRTL